MSKKNYDDIKLNTIKSSEINILEYIANAKGYDFLSLQNYDKAIEIFSINSKQFPNSANTFDSLAEAYMKKGSKKMALKYYKKSLELNSNNDNAKRRIEELIK